LDQFWLVDIIPHEREEVGIHFKALTQGHPLAMPGISFDP